MKKTILFLSIFFLTISLCSPVFATCPEGSSWTAAWTDTFGQTTYTLVAPCKVYIGIPFNITATVTDNTFPDNDIGFGWAIIDNGGTIAGGGFNWITTASGQWQRVIEQSYTGDPVNHTIEFKFADLGQGSGAHMWKAELIGDVTVDPFPPNTPPTVEAGPAILFASEDQNAVTIQGSASDADGGPLTYRWLEDTTVLQSSQPVDGSGNSPLSLATVPPLSIGAHTLILEVTDGTSTVTDTVVVSVENSAPVAAPSGGGTLQMGANILLDGSVADYDGDTLSYRWLEGATVLAVGIIPTVYGGSPVSLPEQVIAGGLVLGAHTLTLEVNDGIHTVTADISVNIIDTLAPTLTPVASADILWPPNGKMREVIIYANAYDNSGGPVMLSVLVAENQPPQKHKYRTVIPDYSIVSIDQSAGVIVLQLRAARAGKGEDRIYSITITAADASENSSGAEVIIKAPHNTDGVNAGRGLLRNAPE